MNSFVNIGVNYNIIHTLVFNIILVLYISNECTLDVLLKFTNPAIIQEKLLQIGRYQFFLLVTNKKKKAFMPRKPDSLNLTELVNFLEFFVHNKNMHGSM